LKCAKRVVSRKEQSCNTKDQYANGKNADNTEKSVEGAILLFIVHHGFLLPPPRYSFTSMVIVLVARS
jgi:hypothetical protein